MRKSGEFPRSVRMAPFARSVERTRDKFSEGLRQLIVFLSGPLQDTECEHIAKEPFKAGKKMDKIPDPGQKRKKWAEDSGCSKLRCESIKTL